MECFKILFFDFFPLGGLSTEELLVVWVIEDGDNGFFEEYGVLTSFDIDVIFFFWGDLKGFSENFSELL